MGLTFNRMKKFYVTGTTAAVANQPMLEKRKNHWRNSHVFPYGIIHRGVQLEEKDRQGTQFRTAEAQFRATGATTQIKKLTLSPSMAIVMYAYNNKGYLKAELVDSAGVITFGAEKEFNGAVVSSCDITKISTTSFAISFIDDGGDDYLAARICTVTAAGVITTGAEKLLVSAACSKNGTGICIPRDGVIAVVHALVSDGHIDVIAATFSGVIIEDPGTTKEFDSTASSTLPDITSYADGKIMLAWSTGGGNGVYRLGTVAVNAIVTVGAAAANFETGTATSIKIQTPIENVVLISWIDSTFAHALVATIDGVTVTAGSALELTAAAALTLDVDSLDSENFVAVYENDATSDLGTVHLFSRSGTVLTTGKIDVFTLSACKNTAVCALTDVRVLVGFGDDGDTNTGKVMLGQIEDHLIDVRSTSASISFGFWMLSLEDSGLGKLAAYPISGTTNSSANTAMSTKPTLPFRKHTNVFVLFKDKGMYVEDDGTVLPKISGVSTTIDVRSTSTSEVFAAYVLRINGSVRNDAY